MDNPYKWRHYEGEIIILCVRWYLRYALSYRDLEEMMVESGLGIATTRYTTCQTAIGFNYAVFEHNVICNER